MRGDGGAGGAAGGSASGRTGGAVRCTGSAVPGGAACEQRCRAPGHCGARCGGAYLLWGGLISGVRGLSPLWGAPRGDRSIPPPPSGVRGPPRMDAIGGRGLLWLNPQPWWVPYRGGRGDPGLSPSPALGLLVLPFCGRRRSGAFPSCDLRLHPPQPERSAARLLLPGATQHLGRGWLWGLFRGLCLASLINCVQQRTGLVIKVFFHAASGVWVAVALSEKQRALRYLVRCLRGLFFFRKLHL